MLDGGMDVVTKHLTVKGRVQGVCFRDWTVKTASALGLRGWVRNRASGDVEAVVQGEAAAVDRFLTLVRDGPPLAQVDAIDVRDETSGNFTGFEQRRTF